MEKVSENLPGLSSTVHDASGNPSGNDTRADALLKETLDILKDRSGSGVGEGVGLGVEEVTGGAGVVACGGDVGTGVGFGFSLGSTSVITQRCSPPKSLFTKNTVSMEQSSSALKKRLQPFVERSLMLMRYVPSSPRNGTKRNKVFPSSGSIVAALESAPRHAPKFSGFKGPTQL